MYCVEIGANTNKVIKLIPYILQIRKEYGPSCNRIKTMSINSQFNIIISLKIFKFYQSAGAEIKVVQ